ncbi:MAG: hypothetical protein HKN82_15370 [Akkermansiaceae bacterium]|nr:hypothetical protein [Akkermansiaceae bacterium]
MSKTAKRPKAKKNDRVLLLPGSSGWEAWTGNGNGLSLGLRTEALQALDVENLPTGELTMAFPVRDVSSLPFRTPTTDEGLFADMAAMHVERFGMRPPIENGILSDYFKVGSYGEESVLLPIVLAPPPEGALPKRSPKSFDISARCLPLPAEAVVVWRELGRWVFGISGAEGPLHFQALASSELDEDAGREIRISLSQLQIQGILETAPKHCFVWLEDDQEPPPPEALAALGRGFGGSAQVAAKPVPVLPAPPSKLLPADIRAERVAKRKRRQSGLLFTALILIYCGLAAWFGWRLFDATSKARDAEAESKSLGPQIAALRDHTVKWEELEPIVSTDHWPVELLFRVAEAIPPNSGLRLKRAEMVNQLDVGSSGAEAVIRTIKLQGEAGELQEVNQFNLNLKRSANLAAYEWITPAPAETKTGGWSFIYDGVYKN